MLDHYFANLDLRSDGILITGTLTDQFGNFADSEVLYLFKPFRLADMGEYQFLFR